VSYASVEDRYIDIMAISMCVMFLLVPVLGYFNDSWGGNRLICGTFLMHGFFTAAIYYSQKEDGYNQQGVFGLVFFTVLLTISAAIAVLTNYAKDLPADVRGTMMGVLAFGSQFLAAFFILACKAMIT